MPRSLVVVALLALLAPVALAGQALPAPIPGTESPLTPAERGAALAELRGVCAFFKVLGAYPIDVH